MKTDIEIAQQAVMEPITKVASELGVDADRVIPYGKYKAKIDHRLVKELAQQKDARVILVTAISPTPAGEGKTTTSVGLADALSRMGKKTILALREPSLGPVFGMKGGAAGGGYAQVVPMEDINLHFTGDLHAIGAANNLLAAMVDNHIYQGNALNIDPRRVTWKRCVDMNDRQLRFITDGLGGKVNGTPREDGFDITVASEVMAVFCLASDLNDLKERLGRIVVAYTFSGEPVTAGQIGAAGAMTALLKDAFDPNLVQTLEHTPALIHGGPFANIAHGCNSAIATRLAMKLADYVVTEAGFGADLGAEKFLDIKCRMNDIHPSVCVVVATVRAPETPRRLPESRAGSAGAGLFESRQPQPAPPCGKYAKGVRHSCLCGNQRIPHRYGGGTRLSARLCAEMGVPCALSEVFAKGGEGGVELANDVLASMETRPAQYAYDENMTVREKIDAICKKIYHAKEVVYQAPAKKMLEELEKNGFDRLAVCVAKTQYSFSDDAALLAAPEGFTMTVRGPAFVCGSGLCGGCHGQHYDHARSAEGNLPPKRLTWMKTA